MMGNNIWPRHVLEPRMHLGWDCWWVTEAFLFGLPQDSLYPIWADFLPGS